MAISSPPSSFFNRLMGRLGGWLGFGLVAVGLLSLAFSSLQRFFPHAATALSLPPLLSDLPLWSGFVPFALGVVCYVWGWGMLRYRSWAPFVAALFLLNLALHLVVLGSLIARRIIAPPVWMLADWEIYRWILHAIVVTLVALLVISAFLLLFGPGGLRAAYVDRHRTQPAPQYRICAKCRSIITRKDNTCSWCEPRHPEARLEPVGAQPGTESVLLTFSREHNRVVVGRRIPDQPPVQAGFVPLDPRVRSEYGTVSAVHASFEFNYQSGQFMVEDQNSTHGTLLIRGQATTKLPALTKHPLADGDILELGGARFVFRVISTEGS